MDKKENLKGAGKKGGAQFPKYSLQHLDSILNPLASKTHTSTLSIEQLNVGVFKVTAKSSSGKIKSSALKQFGLIEGDFNGAKATSLCSKLAMAEGDERKIYYQLAFQNVPIFVNVLKTFHDSKTEKSKIAQYAVSTLKVHFDLKDEFAKILIESAETAGLCTVEGNFISFHEIDEKTHSLEDNLDEKDNDEEISEKEQEQDIDNTKKVKIQKKNQASTVNINIEINPSMDPEKLEKLLKLLKHYDAI